MTFSFPNLAWKLGRIVATTVGNNVLQTIGIIGIGNIWQYIIIYIVIIIYIIYIVG